VRGLKEGALILSVAMAISVGKAEECGREVYSDGSAIEEIHSRSVEILMDTDVHFWTNF
jgi:hypothetical protein